jgi:hypothetical protein
VNFKWINGKWYLSYTTYHRSRKNSVNRVTIYNKIEEQDDLKFQYIHTIGTDFIKKYPEEFNDSFWENNNFIPLAEWIKRQLN